jgi:NAD+ synthase (glutamine-hydrolysing)
MSMYGLNASIPKTMVRALVEHVAKCEGGEIARILFDILDTPVSPELLPPKDGDIAQKTEDIVGPYLLHDFFLYHLIRRGSSPKKVFLIAQKTFEGAFDNQTIEKWLKTFIRRFFSQQFKRSCVPDGVRVGTVALSPRGGFVMPSDATANLWISELDN